MDLIFKFMDEIIGVIFAGRGISWENRVYEASITHGISFLINGTVIIQQSTRFHFQHPKDIDGISYFPEVQMLMRPINIYKSNTCYSRHPPLAEIIRFFGIYPRRRSFLSLFNENAVHRLLENLIR